jgi:hypothetical protein
VGSLRAVIRLVRAERAGGGGRDERAKEMEGREERGVGGLDPVGRTAAADVEDDEASAVVVVGGVVAWGGVAVEVDLVRVRVDNWRNGTSSKSPSGIVLAVGAPSLSLLGSPTPATASLPLILTRLRGRTRGPSSITATRGRGDVKDASLSLLP